MAENEIQIINTPLQNNSANPTTQPETARRLVSNSAPLLLWTPGFIVFFGLVFALGLALASVLTQAWLNGAYPGGIILLGYNLLILGLWIGLLLRTKSPWFRLAAGAGIAWIFFTSSTLLVSLLQLSHGDILAPHTDAVSAIALLGAFVGLSLPPTSFERWDRWFFRLAPLLLLIAPAAAYLFGQRTLAGLEGTLAGVALCLCIAIWWVRPSCWRSQPLPTFLFGIVPFMQLLFNIPHRNETNFFFTQVMLLALILGLLRVLQKERCLSVHYLAKKM
jgi:hypothetical protein